MVLLQDALEEKKLDARSLERALSRNILSPEDFQKQLKQLPDDSENADWINIESLQQDRTS